MARSIEDAIQDLKKNTALNTQAEIQDLIVQLEALQKRLDSEKKEAARIADIIARSLDNEFIHALQANYETHKNFITARNNLLKEPALSLPKAADVISTFAWGVKYRTKNIDTASPEQKTMNAHVKTQYDALEKITCDNIDDQLAQSEAKVLLGQGLCSVDDETKTADYKKHCQNFSTQCTLSPSEKRKRIGWIVGGVVGLLVVGAMVAFAFFTFGVGPVAAVAVAAAVTAKISAAGAVAMGFASFGAAITLGVTALATGVAVVKGGKSVDELAKGKSVAQQKIAAVIATKPINEEWEKIPDVDESITKADHTAPRAAPSAEAAQSDTHSTAAATHIATTAAQPNVDGTASQAPLSDSDDAAEVASAKEGRSPSKSPLTALSLMCSLNSSALRDSDDTTQATTAAQSVATPTPHTALSIVCSLLKPGIPCSAAAHADAQELPPPSEEEVAAITNAYDDL